MIPGKGDAGVRQRVPGKLLDLHVFGVILFLNHFCGIIEHAINFFAVPQPLWSKIKSAQDCVKQFGIIEADDLLVKANDRFVELAREEIEEAKIKRDPSDLKE